MKEVIVLTDNECKRSEFLENLGMSKQEPWMCMQIVKTKLFVYQTYSIFNTDSKIIDFINSKDGVIILFSKPTELLLQRIEFIEKGLENIPTVFVQDSLELPSLVNLGPNRKLFNYVPENIGYGHGENPETWLLNQMNKSQKVIKTSNEITDDQLITLFESSTLPMNLWSHYNRLKIVYYSLRKYGYFDTIDQYGWLCMTWKKYKKTIGHEHLWNYTLTRFWIEILEGLWFASFMNFDQMYLINPIIHNGNLHKEYYTNEVLFTEIAKNSWIVPDKKLMKNISDFL